MTTLKDLNLSPAIINTIENGAKFLRENGDAINHWIEQSQKDETRAKEIIELLINGSIENFLNIEPINGMTLLSVIAQVDDTSQAKAKSIIPSAGGKGRAANNAASKAINTIIEIEYPKIKNLLHLTGRTTKFINDMCVKYPAITNKASLANKIGKLNKANGITAKRKK